eukprot:g25042.t1
MESAHGGDGVFSSPGPSGSPEGVAARCSGLLPLRAARSPLVSQRRTVWPRACFNCPSSSLFLPDKLLVEGAPQISGLRGQRGRTKQMLTGAIPGSLCGACMGVAQELTKSLLKLRTICVTNQSPVAAARALLTETRAARVTCNLLHYNASISAAWLTFCRG